MYRNYKKKYAAVKAVGRFMTGAKATSINTEEEQVWQDSDQSDDDIPEDPIEAEVKECWRQVRKQRHDYDHKPWPTEPLRNNLGWQTIRIFVSSTFTDFHNEREVLVKEVFPELREWLEHRSMRLLECDLRWGIPKDSTTHETIIACMEEIDNCFEENHGEPFFLNLTGARYGWIPSLDEVCEDIRERYDWIPGVSITFMEVLHAAMRRANPNAAFFLRNAGFHSRLPEDHFERFVEEDPMKVKHLTKYKEKLKKYFPTQTFQYSCQYSKTDTECGRERVVLNGYEDFAEKVLNFFKKAIERKYPHLRDVKEMDMEERENASQMNFMMQKADFVCGRSSEIELLSRYVQHDFDESLTLSDEDIETYKNEYSLNKLLETHKMTGLELVESTPILSVFAPPGYGKSALLARFVRKVLESDDLNYLNIFYHFCGKDAESTRRDTLLWRLLLALEPEMSAEDKEKVMQLPGDQLISKFHEVLDLYQAKDKQMVVVIDGINELQSGLSWLPPGLPSKVTCIVSCPTEDKKTKSELLLNNTLRLDLPDIGLEPRKNIAQTFFRRYSKTLDSDQLEGLVQLDGASNALWLLTACEELRVIGDYKYISDKIKAFPSDLEGLFSDLLNRLVKEDDTGYIEKVLCYIEVSAFGISEEILRKLLSGPSQDEPIAPLEWAKVRRQLKSLLRPYMERQLMLQFRHGSISKAVRAKFLKDQAAQKTWHEELASYYEFHSRGDPVHLTRQALPHHLLQAGLNKRLAEYYTKNITASQYQRRQHMQQIRCRNIAMPKASKKAVYCTFCANKVQGKCIICGMFLHKSMEKEAWLCHLHQFHGAKGMDKCCVCGRIQPDNLLKGDAVVCVFCQSGGIMSQCCAFKI